MTEERIKELALKLWQHPMVAFQSDNRDAVLEIITEYFRIIAAEARKEGIEAMRDAAHLCNDTRRFPGAVLSAQEYERWLDGELDIMAERFKEQGNPFEGFIPYGPTAKAIQAEYEERLKEQG